MKMRVLLFCSVFFIVSVKCKFLMIKTESDPKKQVDSGVNDYVVKEMDHGQAVGSDYQDRDPIIEYWIHLHNKLERKCDKLEDLKKGKASLKDEKMFCTSSIHKLDNQNRTTLFLCEFVVIGK